MKKQKKLTVVMDEQLYEMAQSKCNERFGIGLSPLIKVFLKSFVTQNGVGFYVGDDDLCRLFARWMIKRQSLRDMKDRNIKEGTHCGPYLKDLYSLGNIGRFRP